MSLSIIVLKQVAVMFILIAVGFFCYKIKIVNNDGKTQFTNLLLYIVNPLVIINAYQTTFEKRLVINLGIAFLLALSSHIIAMVVSYALISSRKDKKRAAIERFSVIYTNCAFMAIPLIQALFGASGVFYLSAYITIFNLLSWTHGFITISGNKDKTAIIKALVSPVVLSVLIGVLMFFAQIKLPQVLGSAVDFLASLNTPVAMLITGISLAQASLLAPFKTIRNYYIVLIANLIVPIIAMLIYIFLPFDKTIIIVNLVATACPSAVTMLLFSTKFNRDVEYATNLLTLSSLLSIITIPLVVFLYQYLSSLI